MSRSPAPRTGGREFARAYPDRACSVIPHGVDGGAFRPLAERGDVRDRFRDAHRLPREALVVCSVASNNVRKDLARTLAAFARLRATVSAPTALYLHTVPVAGNIDLNVAASACGLTVGRDVIFPRDYHPLQPVTDAALNELYNAADVYFTTTPGEGWGLPVTEAMAAGLPVVAPRHTSLAELGGDGRAILYDCSERVWVDIPAIGPSGSWARSWPHWRRGSTLPDGDRKRMTAAARAFASTLDWSVVAPRWPALADDLRAARAPVPK